MKKSSPSSLQVLYSLQPSPKTTRSRTIIGNKNTAKQGQAAAQDPARSAIGGILVSPLIQRLSSTAGRKAEVVFIAENPGQNTEIAEANIQPFTVEDWTYRTIYGTDHPHDCSNWFKSKTNTVTITPGQRQEVRLQVEIPRGTEGPYWCMLKFTPRPNGSLTKSLVVYEIPIVFIVGKNPKPVVKVGSPLMRRVDPKSRSTTMSAILPLTNDSDGFSVIGASGTLRRADTNRVVADFSVEDRNFMPHSKRELNFVIPNVADGRYKLDFKTFLGIRSLPLVSSDVVITKGVPKLASEVAQLETTPITMEPSSLNLAIPAGGQRTSVVKITNNSNHEISLDMKPVSIEQGTNGSIGIGDGGLPFGLNVEISGEISRIQPGQSATARVRMMVPKEAKGDLWFGLSVKEAQNGSSLADAVFATVSVPKTEQPNLEVIEPTPVKDGSRTIAIKYKVTNSGNVALRPEANATVLADGVRLVARLAVPEVGDGGILPGKTIANSVMLPAGLKAGEYVVEIAYQFGEQNFGRIRVPVSVPATKSAAKGKN